MRCHILMFKEGDKTEIKGVKCDFVRIDLNDKEKYLAMGYVDSIEELRPKKQQSLANKIKRTKDA